MKTKRNNRVAKIAFTLLIVVTLFFSIGAGYQEAANETSVISSVIEKYDALKVIADALHYEVAETETVEVAAQSKEIDEAIITVSFVAPTQTRVNEETVEETYFQFDGVGDILAEDVKERVKEAYKAEGHRVAMIHTLQIYVNVNESRAYYVINGKPENKYIDL